MRLCWEKKWKHIHAVKMQLGMPMRFTGCLFGISPNNVGQITKLHARNPGRCCQHWGYTSQVREHHDIFTGNHRELHILTVVADLWNKRQCIMIQLGSFCVWAQPMRGDASNEAGGRQTHRRGCRMDAQWSASSRHVITIYTPFTQGLRPLCLPCATTKLARSPLKAEGRPNGCLGSSRVAHRTFRHRHGRHGRREVLSMFKTIAQRSPRRSVAHRSLKGGRMKAQTSPWSENGCTVVGHWSPSKKCEHCVSIWATSLPSLYHHCASFDRPMASIERSLWRPLCLHSATMATLEPPWQWFCLHSAFFARPVVPLQQLWSFKESTRVVL